MVRQTSCLDSFRPYPLKTARMHAYPTTSTVYPVNEPKHTYRVCRSPQDDIARTSSATSAAEGGKEQLHRPCRKSIHRQHAYCLFVSTVPCGSPQPPSSKESKNNNFGGAAKLFTAPFQPPKKVQKERAPPRFERGASCRFE